MEQIFNTGLKEWPLTNNSISEKYGHVQRFKKLHQFEDTHPFLREF